MDGADRRLDLGADHKRGRIGRMSYLWLEEQGLINKTEEWEQKNSETNLENCLAAFYTRNSELLRLYNTTA